MQRLSQPLVLNSTQFRAAIKEQFDARDLMIAAISHDLRTTAAASGTGP